MFTSSETSLNKCVAATQSLSPGGRRQQPAQWRVDPDAGRFCFEALAEWQRCDWFIVMHHFLHVSPCKGLLSETVLSKFEIYQQMKSSLSLLILSHWFMMISLQSCTQQGDAMLYQQVICSLHFIAGTDDHWTIRATCLLLRQLSYIWGGWRNRIRSFPLSACHWDAEIVWIRLLMGFSLLAKMYK